MPPLVWATLNLCEPPAVIVKTLLVIAIGPPVTSIPALKFVLPAISITPLLCILNLCALAVAS